VIEYSDFECPFCGRFALQTLPAIVKKYVDTGKLLVAFKHLPLESKHPFALHAAEAAECSRRLGRFWEMHDALFEEPVMLQPESLRAKAKRIGLDSSRFDQCLKGGATTRVKQDLSEAQAFAITGTPTFIFGVVETPSRLKALRRQSGAIPVEAFERIVDQLLESVPVRTR
jgi:protein-disulfide isomerase